jgi:ligand-binding sensor domain-containing protein
MTKKTLIIVLFLILSFSGKTQKLVELWRTGPVMKTPESVLYSNEFGIIFVANMDGDASAKDGNGFISQLTPDGQIKRAEWVTGMNAPKGMAVFNGKLFVSDIDQLVEIDIAKGKINHQYSAPEAIFLNDVAASKDGKIYVSDSRAGKIYILENGKLQEWLADLAVKNINGLYTEGESLYIGSDKLQRIDLKTKAIETIQEGCGGIDGLTKDNHNQFVFSNWAGRIFYLENGKMTKMIDTTKEKINTADLSFAKALNLLLVPTFFDNQVIAYQIEK